MNPSTKNFLHRITFGILFPHNWETNHSEGDIQPDGSIKGVEDSTCSICSRNHITTWEIPPSKPNP